MAAAEELLFERLCKVDPTIPDTLLKHHHRLDIYDYDGFEHVLKTEESSNHELRMAIFHVFDAMLFEFELDPRKAVEYHHFVTFLPVCTSILSMKEGHQY